MNMIDITKLGRKGIDMIIDGNSEHHVWTRGAKRDSEQMEWSYKSIHEKAIKEGYITEDEINGKTGKLTFVDRRYIDTDNKKKVSVLVEVKSVAESDFTDDEIKQLFGYARLERCLRKGVKVIAILANTKTGLIRVWKYTGEEFEPLDDTVLKSYDEYTTYFEKRSINNRIEVLKNATILNKMLHNLGVKETNRCSFVGLLMHALKNDMTYKLGDVFLSTSSIISAIKEVIRNIKNTTAPNIDVDKITSVLNLDVIQNMNNEKFVNLLDFIREGVIANIDDKSNEGMDILSHFFLVFIKYVNREDKNQAFTPEHIARFMAKVAKINRKSVVLDPTCGASTFLINAMNLALAKCETDEERKVVKNNMYGIELDENVHKIATANMLTHSGGYANIFYGSCLENRVNKEDVEKGMDFIKRVNPDVILMNPPYNASKAQVSEEYSADWGDKVATDPTKGFGFVKRIADVAKQGCRLVVLLPQQCAIGKTEKIQTIKRKMLEKHTLDAVFTMPSDLFYPGASAVVCCMVFICGVPHADTDEETFLGFFKDDGFEKRKHLGRIDVNNTWDDIEAEWLELYKRKSDSAGISIAKKLTADDEWCAEAHIETDYSILTGGYFEKIVRDYVAFQIQNVID
jgi:type I restriction-modification system DNA methylase subunit